MYNFFVETKHDNGIYTLNGSDYNHLKNVLRMKVGDEVIVSYNGKSDLCIIKEFLLDTCVLSVKEENYINSELPIYISLYQGLPKVDKLELIIQKAVELGVSAIIPTEMHRSIVKIEPKKEQKKVERWQAISESAAKQSKRNIIPEVKTPLSLKQAVKNLDSYNHVLVPYENFNGMQATEETLSCLRPGDKVAVFIGPEGGFEDFEIELLKQAGAKTISLGKRILRTETAAITTLSMLMLHAETKLN